MIKERQTWLRATKEVSISVPEYWAEHPKKRPQTFEELIQLVQLSRRKAGIWLLQEINRFTGLTEKLSCQENDLTDSGALAMLKNMINSSAGGIAPASYIAVSQKLGHTTITASIASGGTVTSITVGSLTGPTIPSGTALVINPGANQFVVQTAASITGAGSVAITSRTGPASTIPSGSHVRYATSSDIRAAGVAYAVSSGITTDLTSLGTPASYTASLPSGQFTYGTRSVTVTNAGNYLFDSVNANSNPALATAADYTDMWLTKASPVGAAVGGIYDTVAHVPLNFIGTVGAATTLQVSVTETLS